MARVQHFSLWLGKGKRPYAARMSGVCRAPTYKDLSTRALRVLGVLRIRRTADLQRMTEEQLRTRIALRVHSCGEVTLTEVCAFLERVKAGRFEGDIPPPPPVGSDKTIYEPQEVKRKRAMEWKRRRREQGLL